MENTPISLYNGARDNAGSDYTVSEALQVIKSDELSKTILKLLNEKDSKKQDALKQKLPAVTWSGKFSKRSKEGLLQHSGFICIDIDHLQPAELDKLRSLLAFNQSIYAFFVSPRGSGLKVLLRIAATTADEHKEYFDAIAAYFQQHFAPEIRPITQQHLDLDVVKRILPVPGSYDDARKYVKHGALTMWRHGYPANMAIYYFNDLKLTYTDPIKKKELPVKVETLVNEAYRLVDISGSDVSRLCFLSWDTSLHLNENALPFIFKKVDKKSPATKAKPVAPIKTTGDLFADIIAFTDKRFTYGPGTRNGYINAFVMNCKHKGIEQSEVKQFCIDNFIDYVQEHGTIDVTRIVDSVYSNSKFEFGKDRDKDFTPRQSTRKPQPVKPGETPQYNEATLFWYVTTKKDKETGEVKEEHKFDHDGLTWFMANNGFRKIRLGEKGYQFVRINGNLLEALEPDELNKFIVDYLQQNISANKDGVYGRDEINDDLQPVRRMYMRGIKNYSNPAVYSALPAVQPKFLRDTQTHTYLYFENGFVEITADSIKLKPYTELTNHIWAKQKKNFNISLVDEKEMQKSDAYGFISAAIIGEGIDDNDPKRLLSMLTTIGYQVDSYKDPTNAKCVIYCDKEINRTGQESHGGSGKTLMVHMIGKLVNACVLDGKSFRFEDPYPFESLKPDHKMLVFNDVQKKFSFEQLFHKITEDFEYRKKYVDAIIIPFEDSPKPVVITNFTIAGEGSSFRRRQHPIEFSNYFTDEYTPKDEFKRRFFYDWDDAEWNRFYNVFFYAVQKFKKHGLVPFPATNLKLNKLIQAAGESFIDWMDDKVIPVDHNVPLYLSTDTFRARLDRAEVFSMFREECADYRKMENSNTFTGWVKMWCEVRGYEINKHKNYGHDKSGGKYFWTITKKEEPKKQ